MDYVLTQDGELYHYGVKGMKWGVRRYQNKDGSLTPAAMKRLKKTAGKIETMYDRSNKWTDRKIARLDAKGKMNKANVMREMRRMNDVAKRDKTSAILDSNYEQYRDMRKLDFADVLFGGQQWMRRHASSMTTPLNRLTEYNSQRGMRWASNFTRENTLGRMSVAEAYEYLDRKRLSGIMTSNVQVNS